MTKTASVLQVIIIHLHAKFRTISSLRSPRNAGNYNHTKLFLTPVGQIGPILTKIESFLEVVRIHKEFNFWPFLLSSFLGMPRNPNFTNVFGHQGAKIRPVLAKITSGDRQNTSTCQISYNSFLAFSFECHETPITPSFFTTTGPKLGQYWSKSNNFWSVVRTHQNATFRAIPSMRSPSNAQKAHWRD